jgi:hypothetical protein
LIALAVLYGASLFAVDDPLSCKIGKEDAAYTPTYHQSSAQPIASGAKADEEIPNCRHPKNRNQHDSCQQRRQANAAEESRCIAERQFWLGLAGLFGLLITFIYSHRQSESARLSADASIRSARALIHAQHEVPAPTSMVFTAQIFNLGKSPAILVRACRCHAFELNPVPLYDSGAVADLTGLIALPDDRPGEGSATRISIQPGYMLGSKTAFYFGFIEYDDVFGQRHRMGFGFQLTAPNMRITRAGGNAYNYDRQIERPQR